MDTAVAKLIEKVKHARDVLTEVRLELPNCTPRSNRHKALLKLQEKYTKLLPKLEKSYAQPTLKNVKQKTPKVLLHDRFIY